MDVQQDIRSVTYLKSRAAAVLDQINSTRRPIVITQDGEPRAVIQDPRSYERVKRAVALMKLIALGEADIRKGRVVGQRRLFSRLKTRLKKRSNGRS